VTTVPGTARTAGQEIAMSANFFRLTDSNGLEIIVNPIAIRYLVAAGPGTARICFDNVHSVTVRGSPREIQEKLTGEIELRSPPRE
jgi:hypothetical protein